MNLFSGLLLSAILFGNVLYGCAQILAPLVFREDWKEIEAALPVTQEHVANADLQLSLYGPGRSRVKKSNHPHIPNDPFYIWSGECDGNWAVALHRPSHVVDLTVEGAAVRFRSRQSGFRKLHVILKLEDGSWLVSEDGTASSDDCQ